MAYGPWSAELWFISWVEDGSLGIQKPPSTHIFFSLLLGGLRLGYASLKAGGPRTREHQIARSESSV